jgi:hypothetical protein
MSCHQRLAHSGSSCEGDNCIPSELSHAVPTRPRQDQAAGRLIPRNSGRGDGSDTELHN